MFGWVSAEPRAAGCGVNANSPSGSERRLLFFHTATHALQALLRHCAQALFDSAVHAVPLSFGSGADGTRAR